MTGADMTLSIEESMRRVREELKPHFPPQDPDAPRSRARYSDTNYLLLNAILEALCHRPLHEVLAELVFEPAGLTRTYFAGTSAPLAPLPPPATLWSGGQPLRLPRLLESLRSVYSTVGDQIASLRALLSGKLLDRPSSLDLMQRHCKRFGFPRDAAAWRAPGWPIEYGLGMMRFALPRVLAPIRPVPPVLGHSGSTGAWLFYCARYEVLLAGTVDEVSAGAVPFRAVVPRVLRAIGAATAGGARTLTSGP
jgi:D-alanyl-D-alanine carboxypeptidase